jgi:hypothetical protein
LEEEKMAANTVAFQWQSEAVHFEREFISREEIVLQAQHATGQLERRLIELQASIDEKDLSLAELVRLNSAGVSKSNGHNDGSRTKIPESLHTNVILTDSSTLTDPIVQNLMSPPPSMSRNPIPTPVTEGQMTSSFWSEDHLFEFEFQEGKSIMQTPLPGVSKHSGGLSTSVAKRVLLTWDRTVVDTKSRFSIKRPRRSSGTLISHATFLMLVSNLKSSLVVVVD